MTEKTWQELHDELASQLAAANAEIERLHAALDGVDGLLMAAAENLRSADRDERRVEAAFRIAAKLDQLRASLAARP